MSSNPGNNVCRKCLSVIQIERVGHNPLLTQVVKYIFNSLMMYKASPINPYTGQKQPYNFDKIFSLKAVGKIFEVGMLTTTLLRMFFFHIILNVDVIVRSIIQTISRWTLNHFNAEATFVQRTRIAKTFEKHLNPACWYSLDSSYQVLSDEYPCARVSVIFQVFWIIVYWPN